jgi:nitroreductase
MSAPLSFFPRAARRSILRVAVDAILALKTRRSVRSYKPDAVPSEIVEDIVDCGRLAATARNRQPREFVVVTGAPTRQRLAEVLHRERF